MQHSRAYDYLIQQLNAKGYERKDGYYPKIMEEIYSWERDEVEDIIWDGFRHKKDMDLVRFLPKLKKYDGIKALKECPYLLRIPSEPSVEIAQTLYEATKDEKYLEIIARNIASEPDNIAFVAVLSYCTPCPRLHDILADIYINNKDDVNRTSAVNGLLHEKGIIKDMHSIQECNDTRHLLQKFDSEDREERKRILERFENGIL